MFSKLASASRLLGCTLVVAAAPAMAQVAQFDIPAQSVANAISLFSRQSGLQVVAPADFPPSISTRPLSGPLDARVALRELIAGTGLEIASDTGNTIILRNAAPAVPTSSTVPAGATEIAPSAEAGDDRGGDIIVTAQRRAEREQVVPISLTVLDDRAISRYGVQRLEDVSRLTPGLLVSSFSPARPIVAVRGATNTFNQIGVDKPVGVFIDDVYIARNSATTFELFGVKSIQVLRGPQGTLFGRNVSGGAIVIDTGRPAYGETTAAARASYGSYDTLELDGLADVALGDENAVRLSGLIRQHNGWGRDRLTGQELDDQKSRAVRGAWRSQLADNLELVVNGDYEFDASGGRTLSSNGAGDDGDRRTAESGVPQKYRRYQGGVSGRLFLDTDLGQAVSITALRKSRSIDVFSNVAANYSFLTGTQSQAITDDRDRIKTFSQEFRFASKSWDVGNFLLGAYFSNEDSTRQLLSTALLAKTGALVTNQLADQATLSRSFAIFADGTYNITPILSLTMGGRYTWDHKEASLTRTDFRAPTNNFADNNLTRNWSRFTPRAVLRVTPTRDLMAYASYSRGYTAGGFNTEAATLAALRSPFQPETVDNYEAGFKSDLFNHLLRFNLTGFVMKYTDKQELFFDNATRVLNIYNAGRATIKGVELDTAIHPVRWFTLSATYGLLDSRYDQFVIPNGAVYTGNRLGSAPHDKVSVTGDIDIPVGEGRFFGSAVYSYTSTYNTGAAADPGLVIPGYSLVNGTLGYAFPGDRLQISGFIRNAFNKEYILIRSTQVVRGTYLGAPRIIGATISAKF